MRDPKETDIKYEDGFPANIDWKFPLVLQVIAKPLQSVVLYRCNLSGKQTRCYLPGTLSDIFNEGLFLLNKEYNYEN